MKAKLLAVTLTILLFCYLAAAQDYCIRVNRRINLRDAASLQSNVLETVATGTTLTVVGELNQMLKISRNGNEAWMASWVDYSRVDDCGGAQAPAQPLSAIDNCCFVDRQCQSDQEWTEGYWAFQNGQCQAPAQTGAPASSQPVSGAPAQIDNCCFVDRQCRTELDWISGYHAYQNNQCGAPGQTGASGSSQPAGGVVVRSASGVVIGSASGHTRLPSTSYTKTPALGQTISFNNCCQLNWQCDSDQDRAAGYHAFQNDQCGLPGEVISIVGDPDFIDFYAQRLEELRNRLPQRYSYVLSSLDKIEQAGAGLLGGRVSHAGRILFMPWSGPLANGWDTRRSAILVHEACHVHRFHAGHPPPRSCGDREGWIREEVPCREMELEVLIALDAPAHVIEWARGMVAETRAGENYYEYC